MHIDAFIRQLIDDDPDFERDLIESRNELALKKEQMGEQKYYQWLSSLFFLVPNDVDSS